VGRRPVKASRRTSGAVEFANASDVDDGERGCSVEEDDEGENVAEAVVPFVAKIAARVRSASGTEPFVARQENKAVDSRRK